MTATRLRSGALLWLLTLQFFVVEAVAQLRWDVGSYSRTDDVNSDLGTALSPARFLMNASFVVQGLLIAGGAMLLGPALRGGAARVAQVLLGLCGLGVLLVGVFPSDANGTLHGIGAVAHFVGGGVGLIALAYAVRPRSEALGTTLAVLGLVGTAATVFFLFGVVELLGEGGTERVAAYVVPTGLAIAAIGLWRFGTGPDPEPDEGAEATERQLRARERAERRERARRRDEALEAAAARQEASRATPGPADDDTDGTDEDDEDPWSPSVRDDRRR